MVLNEFSPVVIKAGYFNGMDMQPGKKLMYRTVYDYEVEFYLKSNGGIEVDGEYIPFEAGDINIRKPGQYVCGVTSYECYIVCLDLMGNADKGEDYVYGRPEQAQPLYDNSLILSMPNKIPAGKAYKLGEIVTEIYQNSIFHDELSKYTVKTLGYVLMHEMVSYSVRNNKEKRIRDKKINDAVNFINHNFSEQIDLKELIGKSGYGKAQFYKLFINQTGTTPNKLITDLRMNKAKRLLILTDQEISEIADNCGYSDNVYFSYLFKKQTGLTPTQYRK